MNDTLLNAPFSVGDWRVDPALRQIARGTEIVRVDPRNVRVLQLLAARAGQIVSQRDIEKIVWTGVTVTPDSVYQSVAQLRRALGEDKTSRRYIETVPRKGYRLVVPVTYDPVDSSEPPASSPLGMPSAPSDPAPVMAPSASASSASPTSASATSRSSSAAAAEALSAPGTADRTRRLLWAASIALFVAITMGVAVVLIRPDAKPSAVPEIAATLPSAGQETRSHSGVPPTRTELPQSYQGDKTFRQAITYLETELKAQSETSGPEDPALVAILSRLANIYLLVSDPRRSELAGRRGLSILDKLGGMRSAEGVELHATLAEALADVAQFDDAESHLQTALQLAREVHGEAHEVTVAALAQLALLRIAQRRFADAEQLARRALETHRRLPEWGTARAAFLTSTIAWALIEQGRASEAISPLDEALRAIRPDDPPAPYLVALAHHFRGEALNRVGRHAEAEIDFRSELDLFAKIPHVRMDEARGMSALAESRLMQGAVAEAATLLARAQDLLKDGDGWRERKARQENSARIQQLPRLDARAGPSLDYRNPR